MPAQQEKMSQERVAPKLIPHKELENLFKYTSNRMNTQPAPDPHTVC